MKTTPKTKKGKAMVSKLGRYYIDEQWLHHGQYWY